MILESITGLDSLSVGDVIVDTRAGNHQYRVDEVNQIGKNISITYIKTGSRYGYYGISTFTKPFYKVQRQFMPYDPNQQGEDDDSI